MMREYTVFNVDQCDNLPARIALPGVAKPRNPDQHDATVDEFLTCSGATIREGLGEAYYAPGDDSISLPGFAAFCMATRIRSACGATPVLDENVVEMRACGGSGNPKRVGHLLQRLAGEQPGLDTRCARDQKIAAAAFGRTRERVLPCLSGRTCASNGASPWPVSLTASLALSSAASSRSASAIAAWSSCVADGRFVRSILHRPRRREW
jgi:hypothetical protein